MILLAYGTRPEYIKIKPLVDKFNTEGFPYKTLFTGQHTDLVNDLKPDYTIDIKNGLNRLDSIIQSVMNVLPNIKQDDGITHVLVQGDTASVLAVALSAFNNGIKVIHLEAGLRTYNNDNPYPEEQYRRLVSQITDIHLCPTMMSRNNLENERILGMKYVVGNTVLDNLVSYKDECEYTNKILVTLHRRENHEQMDKWFIEVDKLAEKYPEYEFILPIHPNPNVQKHRNLLKHVNVIDPLPYDELLNLLVKTRLVITDSGGLQEECSFFNKKCLTCRKVTERPEAVGESTIMVSSPEDLYGLFIFHINEYEIDYKCPFGNGNSSDKIMKILKEL